MSYVALAKEGTALFYVYILCSATSEQIYIGQTDDLRRRFAEHNSGKSFHTKKYIPWNLNSYFAFENKDTAIKFEKYLKTGSGKAFLHKRLI